MEYKSTAEILRSGTYFGTADEFFGNFSAAWDAARCQVLKLETKQTYQEPDNESYQLFINGDMGAALEALQRSRADDQSLYDSIRQRGIDFIRCRPVAFPVSDYIRWAVHSYKHNAAQGERIFWCNEISLREFFASCAKHDFMVFDSKIAFIHNYDNAGLIQGGWRVENWESIRHLINIFSFIKANCNSLKFLSEAISGREPTPG